MPNNVRVGVQTTGVGKASSEIDRLRDKFDRLQKQGAKGIGIGVGAAITTAGINAFGVAVGSATDLLGDAVSKASDLNETLSKSAVVFGFNADEIEAWGDTAAESFGLSKNAAIASAASFGDLFNKVGLGRDKATEMSQSLVGLSADLASFNNLAGGSEEALEKIRSGLAGETEPLRSLGVFLNEAKVKAKALELGLAGAHGELSEGAKIQARYALILEETMSAQGDFARTSDELANKQRINQAKLDDALAKLGNILLPVVSDAAEDAAGALEGLSIVLGLLNGELPKSDEGLQDVSRTLAGLNPVTGMAVNQMENLKEKAEEVEQAAKDLAEAQLRLSETTEETTARLKAQGKAADGTRDDIRGLEASYNAATRAASNLAAAIVKAARASGSGYIPPAKNSGLGPKAYAEGGWAGLHGPELAVLGDGGEPELVTPKSKLAQMPGAGGMTIVYSPQLHGMQTPATIAAFVNEAGPALVDYLRRTGWSPR